MTKLETINDLRNMIAEELVKVANKESNPAAGNAVANLAGKIITSVKLDLEYAKLTRTTPNIDFLNVGTKKNILEDKS